jgi:WD40 repeat protein
MFNLTILEPQFASFTPLNQSLLSHQLEFHQIKRSLSILKTRKTLLELEKFNYFLCHLAKALNHPLPELRQLIHSIRTYSSAVQALELKLLVNYHVEKREYIYLTDHFLKICSVRYSNIVKRFSAFLSPDAIINPFSDETMKLDNFLNRLQIKYDRSLLGTFPIDSAFEIYTIKYRINIKELEYGLRAITSDNKYLIYCSIDNPPYIVWDILTNSIYRALYIDIKDILKVAISPNNEYIVFMTEFKFILWYYEKDILQEITHDYRIENILEISSDSRFLISVSSHKICVWNAKTKRLVNLIILKSTSSMVISAISSNDQYLALSDFDNNIQIWDLITNRRITFIPAGDTGYELEYLKFVCENKYLVISMSGQIRIWDMLINKRGRFYSTDWDSVQFKGLIKDRYVYFEGIYDRKRKGMWDLKMKRKVNIDLKSLKEFESGTGDSTLFFSNRNLWGVHVA